MWATIKEMTTQMQPTQKNSNINIDNNNYESDSDPLFIANTFNTFFTSMGSQNNATKKLDFQLNSSTDKHSSNQSMYLRKINTLEVNNIISNMKGDSAPGKDGISNNIVKQIKESLSEILAHIFNTILWEGTIPDYFKSAIVTPIYKNGDKKLINNYRPISLLNIFSKIFERAIKTRLLDYLEENNILPKSQYGFRKNLGTEDALARLSMDIYRNLNNNKKTLGIFLDLKSYLDNRKQQVRINNTLSDEIIITTGVPQGTVLSPILYIIYVSSLSHLNIHGKLFSYADDRAILVSGDNWDEVHLKAETETTLDK
ncbi:Reverse transcriptase domain [Cinara cedri]|uniref:Reverse transcriptase domain n=1 Tax=Cinara cedri TaxID=506608 RepID=A0A5E4NCA4_9HEMI|nr:Reverse transcriptase domain [Cinara cedri]